MASKKIVNNYVGDEKLSRLFDAVCAASGVDRSLAISTSRVKMACKARNIFSHIARNSYIFCWTSIAEFLGKDHATVMSGVAGLDLNTDTNEIISKSISIMENRV